MSDATQGVQRQEELLTAVAETLIDGDVPLVSSWRKENKVDQEELFPLYDLISTILLGYCISSKNVKVAILLAGTEGIPINPAIVPDLEKLKQLQRELGGAA